MRSSSVIVRKKEAHLRIPFGLVFREDLALRVVTNVTDIGETANIELCSTELGHDDDCRIAMGGGSIIWGHRRGPDQKFGAKLHDV